MEYSFTFLLWLRALLPLFVLAITFYVLIIKPIEKQRKAGQFIEKLRPGMRVQTQEGRVGVIVLVLQSTVIISFDDGTKSEIAQRTLCQELAS